MDKRDLLYVSDLDGTLLTPDSYLSIEGVERLNLLIEKGLNFTVATARNYDSVYPVLHHLRLKLPIILFNGVYLTDFHTGNNIDCSNFLDSGFINNLMVVLDSFQVDPFVYTCDQKNFVYYRNITNLGAQNYINYVNGLGFKSRLRYTKSYNFLKKKNVPGLLFIDTYDTLEPLYRLLTRKYYEEAKFYFSEDISQPSFFWLQVFHRRANKGFMLKKLAKRLGFSLKNIVVFGDYLNDLEMFETAGRAVAVGNALPEVKSAADEIIGANADFAVIKYLEKIFYSPLVSIK